MPRRVKAQDKKTPYEQTLTFGLPKNLHTALKIKCAEEGRTMGDVLNELLERYVYGKKSGRRGRR